MKCPKCGNELKKGNLYCEFCGEEIHIVPDFDPEIENSIKETLSTVAKELSPSDFDEKETIDRKKNEKSSLINKRNIIFIIICFIILILIPVISLEINSYKNNSAEIQSKKAVEEYDNKHYAEAAEYYKKALEIDNTVMDYYFQLADCYLKMGEDKKAEETYLKLIKIDEHNEQAYEQLILLYDRLGEYNTINNLLVKISDENIKNNFQSYMAIDPDFNYEGGSYDEVIPLKLIGASFGKIYYTLDGSTPGTGSFIYTAPIFLKKGNYTVKAIYINDYGICSNVIEKIYNIKPQIPDNPQISPDDGTYDKPQLIKIEVPEGCNVYYTTDGSAPTQDSSIYGEPIPMPIGDSNYKFITISSEGISGDVVKREYKLNIESNFGPQDAINNVRYRLVQINHLLDAEGHLATMSGKNIYVYNCLRFIDDKTLYFIYEYYQDGNSSRNMTGNVYAVDVMEGRVYKATKNEDGSYFIEPI